MNLIFTLETETDITLDSIFLAGPTYRAQPGEELQTGWRKDAISYLEKLGFQGDVFVPEWRDGKKPDEWTYSRQVSWEGSHLKSATVILFWIPRDLKNLPAFTTNTEFGEWLNSGKIVVGAPDSAEKNEYLKERCGQMGIIWQNDLNNLCKQAIKFIQDLKGKLTHYFFTADTHFGNDRTLQLVKRPFKTVEEMDGEMVKQWNMTVTNDDVVYHLGDFGNPKILPMLNFKKMFLIRGNYESDDILDEILKCPRVTLLPSLTPIIIQGTEFLLVHEPDKGLKNSKKNYLFGHIHRTQMIKKNGLNVGVDLFFYKPVSEDEIIFWWNGLKKHMDNNVFQDVI